MTAAVTMHLGLPRLNILSKLAQDTTVVLIVLSKIQKAKYSSCKHSKRKNTWQAYYFTAAQSTSIICPTLSFLCHFMPVFGTCMFSITCIPLPFMCLLHCNLIWTLLHHCTHYREGWQRAALSSFLLLLFLSCGVYLKDWEGQSEHRKHYAHSQHYIYFLSLPPGNKFIQWNIWDLIRNFLFLFRLWDQSFSVEDKPRNSL